MQIQAAPLVDPPHSTTADRDADREGDRSTVRNPESGSFPTLPSSDSAERLVHAVRAAKPVINQATAISQFMEEKSAIPSFDQVESISEKHVPLGGKGRGDKVTWVVRHTLWLCDQKQRAAVSTESTRSDGGEAHENPWKPCPPSEDARKWNGGEGLEGTPPGVDSDHPATSPVTDGPTATDVQRTPE